MNEGTLLGERAPTYWRLGWGQKRGQVQGLGQDYGQEDMGLSEGERGYIKITAPSQHHE